MQDHIIDLEKDDHCQSCETFVAVRQWMIHRNPNAQDGRFFFKRWVEIGLAEACLGCVQRRVKQFASRYVN